MKPAFMVIIKVGPATVTTVTAVTTTTTPFAVIGLLVCLLQGRALRLVGAAITGFTVGRRIYGSLYGEYKLFGLGAGL